ncbi:MAG: glycoside hydrolase domain-containing protein [Candidatus Omnitrophota bacterium]
MRKLMGLKGILILLILGCGCISGNTCFGEVEKKIIELKSNSKGKIFYGDDFKTQKYLKDTSKIEEAGNLEWLEGRILTYGKEGYPVHTKLYYHFYSEVPLSCVEIRVKGYANAKSLGSSNVIFISKDGENWEHKDSTSDKTNLDQGGTYQGELVIDTGDAPKYKEIKDFWVKIEMNSVSGIKTPNPTNGIEKIQVTVIPVLNTETPYVLSPKTAVVTITPEGKGRYLYEDSFDTEKYLDDADEITQSEGNPLTVSWKNLRLVGLGKGYGNATLVYKFSSPYPMNNIIFSLLETTDTRNFGGHMTIERSLDGLHYQILHPDTPSEITDKQLGIPARNSRKFNLSDNQDYQRIKSFYLRIKMWEGCGIKFDAGAVMIDNFKVEADLDLSAHSKVISFTGSFNALKSTLRTLYLKTKWLSVIANPSGKVLNRAEKMYRDFAILDEDIKKEISAGLENFEELEKKFNKLKSETSKMEEEIVSLTQNKKIEYCLGIQSPLNKVFKDRDYLGPMGDTVKISMARNEYENFQIIVIPLNKNLEDIKVEFSDLLNLQTGNKIKKENIKYNVVGYVEVKPPLPYAVEYIGFWPDPLLPGERFGVKKDAVQPIWITTYVPEDTPPGEYEGWMTITPSNSYPNKVKVKVQVWNFTLPKETHFPTSFWMFRYMITTFYFLNEKQLPWEIYKKFLDIALEHRLTPFDFTIQGEVEPYIKIYREPDGSFSFDYTDLDRYLSYIFRKGGNAFNIGFACWHFQCFTERVPVPGIDRATGEKIKIGFKHRSPEYLKMQEIYIKNLYEHLKEKGWLDKVYLEAFDDAPVNGQTNEVIKELYGLSHKAAPGLLTYMDLAGGPQQFEELIGYLDIWIPFPDSYENNMDFFIKRKDAGDKVWWFVADSPYPPCPTFHIPVSAIDPRIIWLMGWKYNIDGFLYWGLNIWAFHDEGNLEKDSSKRWPNNPWKLTRIGDGLLIWPGPQMEPLSSIRLESIRDGLEDYEYLYLLREKANLLKDNSKYANILKDVENILKIDPKVVKDVTHYTHDPSDIYTFREKIAGYIEKINESLSAK